MNTIMNLSQKLAYFIFFLKKNIILRRIFKKLCSPLFNLFSILLSFFLSHISFIPQNIRHVVCCFLLRLFVDNKKSLFKIFFNEISLFIKKVCAKMLRRKQFLTSFSFTRSLQFEQIESFFSFFFFKEPRFSSQCSLF